MIVGSASGGFAGAIVLYEAALGVGIACGPLLGGLLGNLSWRGPFFGVSVLMLVALAATVTLVSPTPRPAQRSSITEPLKALRHRSLATTSVTGLLYNWGFFTILGYAPFLMDLSPLKLGGVFCAWGVLVALFAVFGAPAFKTRFGTPRTLYRANVPPESWVLPPVALPAVQAPTMGIWSSGDMALTETQMTDSAGHVAGSWRYERIDGPGHWLQLEAPDTVSRLLLDFLPG